MEKRHERGDFLESNAGEKGEKEGKETKQTNVESVVGKKYSTWKLREYRAKGMRESCRDKVVSHAYSWKVGRGRERQDDDWIKTAIASTHSLLFNAFYSLLISSISERERMREKVSLSSLQNGEKKEELEKRRKVVPHAVKRQQKRPNERASRRERRRKKWNTTMCC